jgi:tetratricopeptide (TPR) repeat protein
MRGVPKRVLDVLERGLAAEPSARWPSLDALLHTLERAMRRKRWWLTAAVSGVVAAVAASAYLAIRIEAPDEGQARAAAERTIAAAWNPTLTLELAIAFKTVDATNGPPRAAALSAALDKYRDDWLAARADAWAATHVRGEQTLELLQRRIVCFDHLADAMGQVVTLLAEPSAKEVSRGPDLAAQLEPIATCNNAQRLAAQSVAPSTPAGRAAAAELNRLEALQMLGRNDEALRQAKAALTDPATLADPMLHARARYNLGVSLMNAGQRREAESVLRLAVQEAAAAHDHYLVATVWTLIVELVAEERPKEAMGLEQVAQAAVAQAGSDPRQLAHLAFALGMAESEVDDKAARRYLLEARDRWIAIYGSESEMVAEVELNLGALDMIRDDYDEAARYLDHARQIVSTTLGDKHPGLAMIDLNRAQVALHRHDVPIAEASLRSALAVDLAAHGPAYPEVLATRVALSHLFRETQRYAEAHQSLALARQSITPNNTSSPEALSIDEEDAALALAEHKWARAEALAKRAVEAYEKLGGQPEHCVALDDLAKAVAHRAPREALPIEERSLQEYLEAPHGVADIAQALRSMASIAIAANRADVALAWFDKYPDAAAQLADVRASLERLQHEHSK